MSLYMLIFVVFWSLATTVLAGASTETAASATITAAPELKLIRIKRATDSSIDPVSLAKVLLTAVPASIQEVAVTNAEAASSILWSDFLDNHTPSWFAALPTDIQSYLSHEFGPSTSASAAQQTAASLSKSSSPSPSPSQPPSQSQSPSSGSSTASSTASGSSHSTSSESSSATSHSSTDKPTASHSSASSSSPASQESSTLAKAAPTTGAEGTGNSKHHSGLTTGAKVGIAIGVVLAVGAIIALVILLCLCLRRRRENRSQLSSRTSISSRVPTPAFISSSYNPHGQTTGLRGGAGSLEGGSSSNSHNNDIDSWNNGNNRMEEPVYAEAVNSNNRRQSRRSSSLQSVPEVPETNGGDMIPVVPDRNPRRSSFHDRGDRPNYTPLAPSQARYAHPNSFSTPYASPYRPHTRKYNNYGAPDLYGDGSAAMSYEQEYGHYSPYPAPNRHSQGYWGPPDGYERMNHNGL